MRSHPAWTHLFVALCLIAGCAPADAPEESTVIQPRRGGTAVLGSISDVDNRNESLSRHPEAAREWEAMRGDLTALQRRIHEDQPYTFLYEKRRLAVYGPRLHGVEIDIPTDSPARLERFWVR